MKKYPDGSVQLYKMIDEAKVFLSDCFKRNKQYVNVETMSYEEMICRLYIECDNLSVRNDDLQRQLGYAQQNVEKARECMRTE